MGDYRQLEVWRRAHALTLRVYRETARWPAEGRFRLVSQVRRAAYSIPSNLAEGCGRGSDCEFLQFARYSLGSASELHYFLGLAADLGYGDRNDLESLASEAFQIQSMTGQLAKTTRARLRVRR